ncbi:MAG: carboxypeptidase regulatory-like domain-containing protein [Gemmatimonadaceae bacterium]
MTGRPWLGVPRRLAAIALATVVSVPTAAQTTTGSIRGYVRGDNGAPVGGATVQARNVATNAPRLATSNDLGYYALVGLVPGEYDVTARRIGVEPQTRRLRVQIGEVASQDFELRAVATQLAAVAVTAAPANETKTSEVATNVSAEQINALPSVDRNFLALAQLAPGVRILGGRREATTKSFTAGALPAQSINVFIDGASYKSDVLPSGVVGQEASRGNPFPQVAVQEFRVLTNNYKAEYQKATSAIITATTKSGTNQWKGSALYAGQTKGLLALDEFQRRNKRRAESLGQAFVIPDYRRDQSAISLGGPLVKDKLFFFGAYEGNYQDRSNIVSFGAGASRFPTVFSGKDGFFVSPFRSNLGIAKLNLVQNQSNSWELSYNLRTETDIRSFGGQTSFQAAENVKVDVNTLVLKHTFASGNRLNEAMVSYQGSRWNPVPENDEVIGILYEGIGRVGGRDSYQNFDQKRLSFRNDLTYSGWTWAGGHVVKVGGNADRNQYDVQKFFNGNPLFRFRATENFAFPYNASYGFGNPNMNTNNTQIGLYAQDD